MTFNEAKAEKEKFEPAYTIEGEEYVVLVVPSDPIGRKAYFTNQRGKKITDESATIYSTDFEVNAILFKDADVFYKRNLPPQ